MGDECQRSDASRVSDEPAEGVARWIRRFGAAVAASDFAAARPLFHEDAVGFGTRADVARGRDRLEQQQWRQIWPAIRDFRFELGDLVTELSPDQQLAVAVVPWSSTGFDRQGACFDRPGRATLVLRLDSDGEWRCTHSHFSLAHGVPQETWLPSAPAEQAQANGDTPEHPYSLVRKVDGAAYVSGVLPYGADGAMVTTRPEAVECAIGVLARRLETAGLSLRDVVKTTVFLTDLDWRPDVDRVWYRSFMPPRPARTAVEVRRLPRDAPIEIEAIAVPDRGRA